MAKKKKYLGISEGIAHIKSTFNNTIITITDSEGNVICDSSAGKIKFKGTRKGTPFAAQQAAMDVGQKAISLGINKISVQVKGPGSGRETAIRALKSAGLNITSIKDVTSIPHNGCRPPKKRKV